MMNCSPEPSVDSSSTDSDSDFHDNGSGSSSSDDSTYLGHPIHETKEEARERRQRKRKRHSRRRDRHRLMSQPRRVPSTPTWTFVNIVYFVLNKLKITHVGQLEHSKRTGRPIIRDFIRQKLLPYIFGDPVLKMHARVTPKKAHALRSDKKLHELCQQTLQQHLIGYDTSYRPYQDKDKHLQNLDKLYSRSLKRVERRRKRALSDDPPPPPPPVKRFRGKVHYFRELKRQEDDKGKGKESTNSESDSDSDSS